MAIERVGPADWLAGFRIAIGNYFGFSRAVTLVSSAGVEAPAGTAAAPTNIVNANPATIVTGQVALTANNRGQLASNALVNGVIVKSSPNNAANVLIGGSAVTSTADGTGNGYILTPGEAASFGVTNTNAIYAISTAAAVLSFEGN
jgi:hypothetical protein